MRLLLGRRIWGPHVPCRTVSPCFQKSVVCGPPRGHPVRAARVDRNQSTVSEIDLYKVVETPRKPDAPLSSQSGMPWYISIPAGFVALIATLRVIKAFRKRRYGDL